MRGKGNKYGINFHTTTAPSLATRKRKFIYTVYLLLKKEKKFQKQKLLSLSWQDFYY